MFWLPSSAMRVTLSVRKRSNQMKRGLINRAQSAMAATAAALIFSVAGATPALAGKAKASVATNTQTSITLLGGVATNIGHDDTTWTSSKVLNDSTNVPTNNAGNISWTVTVTKQSVSDKTLEVDGLLSVQNTGSYPATIGNVIVNLQKFHHACGIFKNIWVSTAADMADGDNDIFATSDNIVAAASQENITANAKCGAGNYKITTLPSKAQEGTYHTTGGSGTLAFDFSSNPWFAINEPNNVIPAGMTATFTYQATFDNTILGLNPGDQIRTETIVTFGNAGARGGSGASAPGFDIDGDNDYTPAEDGLYVRSVPTRTSMQVSSVCVHCNQLVTITDDASDVSAAP